MYEHLLQELLARVSTVILLSVTPPIDIFASNLTSKSQFLQYLRRNRTILAVSEAQRIFLYLSDTNTDRLDIDVCGVLVLTVCEHLPSQVLKQCINTTFCQVFNTKHSQRRGVDVLMLIRAR